MIKYRKIAKESVKCAGIEARPVQGRTISTKDIALEMEKTIGIPAIRTMSVLNAFVEVAYNHLEEGEPILLDGFGTFKPGLGMEDDRVIAKKINLIASKQMKERLAGFLTEETEDS